MSKPLLRRIFYGFYEPAFYYAASIMCVAATLIMQNWLPLGHDMVWLLHVAREYLEGATLYVDVIEVNPPLIIFISCIPIWIADLTGISEVFWYKIVTLLTIVAVLCLVFQLLRTLFQNRRPILCLFFITVLLYLLTLPQFKLFGQREHFIVIFSLPYVVLCAIRISGASISFSSSLFSGVLGGLAIALKPYHIITFFLLELLVLCYHRRLFWFLRTEVFAVAITGLCYVAATYVLTPHYFTDTIPMAVNMYWAYQDPFLQVINPGLSAILLGILLLSYLTVRKNTNQAHYLANGFFIAAIGSYMAYLAPSQAWLYHGLPFFVYFLTLVVTALGIVIHNWIGSTQELRKSYTKAPAIYAVPGLLLAIPALTLTLNQDLRFFTEPTDAAKNESFRTFNHHDVEFQTLLNEHTEGKGLYTFDSSVNGKYPNITYAGAKHTSRYVALWMLPAIILSNEQSLTETQRAYLSHVKDTMFLAVKEDLNSAATDFALVDVSKKKFFFKSADVDYIKYFSQDCEFRQIWSQFRYIQSHTLGNLKQTFELYERVPQERRQIIVPCTNPDS